jgi:hypothetical protein
MKILFTLVLISGLSTGIFSQPLNGSYTIGGNSPDYITLQDAANALKINGVSGAVLFNIRPGTYMKNGGNNTVLKLDSTVTGLSSSNRITFQPDDAAGGNVDNVILEMNITDPNTSDASLVLVSLDFITFNNMTFQEADASQNNFNICLMQLQTSSHNSPVVEGIVFEGCKFKGSAPSNTKTGISFGQGVSNITIRENTFIRLLRGISGISETSTSTGNIIIENNQFLAGWRSSTGAGDPLGSAMEVRGTTLIIKGNLIDFEGSFNGGYRGISASAWVGTETIIIEQNSIKGLVSAAINLGGFSSWITDSIVVANNMINVSVYQVWANESASGLFVTANNARIIFNTIVLYGSGSVGLGVYGDDCEVFNNIIINRATSVSYDQGYATQSANLQSDYNVIYTPYSTGSWPLVISDGIGYYSLLNYQNATSLDTNSIFKDVEFVSPDDLHLTECQSQDPELRGIPIQGIATDFDEEIRNQNSPMMGADENNARMNDMFGEPFITELPGTALSISAGKYDNLLADGIAVPDYDNKQVLLFHYNGDKTFSQSGTLQTPYPPTEVKFFDLDKDAHLDLIVGFYANNLQIFWGDGIGGFPSNTILTTPGHVKSIEIGNDNFFQEQQVFLTIDDGGFPPNISFMTYIADDNGRENVEVVLIKKPGTNVPDTIYAVMDDIAIGNIDAEPNDEIVALTISIPSPVYIFNDTTVSGNHLPYSINYRYVFGNTYSLSSSSSISINDFDGDGDNDFVTTGYDSDELVLIKNLGNYVFADEVIIARQTRGFVVMDYENDGDKDIVTMNERLENNGITVFLNDGFGNFTTRENCYFPHADGKPWSIIASDFDLDGRTDIAITSTTDSLYFIYNLGGGTVGIQEEEIIEIPTSFSLTQNFPNPFNPTTTIQFSLPKAGDVTLKVYNLLGEEVKTLVNEYKQIGNHSVQFNANSLASGIYFYRIQAGSFVETKKMILLR